MNLPENNQKKQEFLSRLNANISSIAFNTYKPNDSSAYNICYSLLTNTIDYIVDEIQNVKCTLGLNTFHIEDSYPSIDISKRFNFKSQTKNYLKILFQSIK